MHSYSANFYKYENNFVRSTNSDQGTWQLPASRNQSESASYFTRRGQNHQAPQHKVVDSFGSSYRSNQYVDSIVDESYSYTHASADSATSHGGYDAFSNDDSYGSNMKTGRNNIDYNKHDNEMTDSYKQDNMNNSWDVGKSDFHIGGDTEMQQWSADSSTSNSSMSWKAPHYNNTGHSISNRRGNGIGNRFSSQRGSRGHESLHRGIYDQSKNRRGCSASSYFNKYDAYSEPGMCQPEINTIDASKMKNDGIVKLNATNYNKWGYLRKNFGKRDNDLVEHLFELHEKFCNRCAEQMNERKSMKRKRTENSDDEIFVTESGEEIKDENLTAEELEIQKLMGFSGFKSMKFDNNKGRPGDPASTNRRLETETTAPSIPFGAPAIITPMNS